MLYKKMLKALSLTSLLFIGTATADEGMWQPHQLQEISGKLKKAGLKLDPTQMENLDQFPMNAIISLGGCTASFLSDQGLVVTNHHCAYGSIQYNSSEEDNLLKQGFVAKKMSDELQAAPGSRVYVTESLTNVTDKVTGSIEKSVTGKAYFKAIEKNEKELVQQCETSQDYRCEVYSFHGGLEYFLIKQLAIRDVRLVYAPPSSIGKFGGDTDNWMWPRHTGDWAFYRAYVSKDGKPADYAKDNVPFKPKAFLKVNANGVEENDYVMVLGYPGRTNRYRNAQEVENQFNLVYPTAKRYREEYIDIIKSTAPTGSEARIKYESTLAGLANYAKNYGSMIESFHKGDMLARKQQELKELQAWINASQTRKQQYGKTLTELNALITKGQENQDRDLILSYIGRTNLMGVAKRLYRLANEKNKPSSERKQGYQERDMNRFTQGMKRVNRRYDANIDKAVLAHFMAQYAEFPASERNTTFDQFFGLDKNFDAKKLAAKLDKMHSETQLDQESVRLAWMDKSVEDFKNSNDPYIQFAVSQYENDQKLEQEAEDLAGKLAQIRPQFMKAMIAYKKSKGEPVYADANSSLRITYGNVKGYSPQDGLTATPFTTLEGMLAKYIAGDHEFDLFKNIRTAIANKDFGNYKRDSLDSVPVNYLSTLDITGGNSGSPTLNGNGEFVGLVFDGVYESIIGDWDYDPKFKRAIHTSVPFMLWTMEHIDGASNIVNEMTIVK
ncbi:S46 family peptidase [Thalassotalea profundi]|uniref:Dipeptidyl-peptidase n=1 Tax=Thalassotalea profundi TaxID=2036687 RepID=A0ABQ3ILN2_9GAMM|nr:S46 family peptidase [Thalassotalea profundi]GHE86528.1 dipeptidyl peptidase S46 family protein [Thalassotalea profundi]